VYLPANLRKMTVVLAVAVFALIAVAVQDLGGILAGGATDPNGAPLVVLVALIYWPLTTTPEIRGGPGSSRPPAMDPPAPVMDGA
jgi:hypothetical protein